MDDPSAGLWAANDTKGHTTMDTLWNAVNSLAHHRDWLPAWWDTFSAYLLLTLMIAGAILFLWDCSIALYSYLRRRYRQTKRAAR
jgi:hypothetical protein